MPAELIEDLPFESPYPLVGIIGAMGSWDDVSTSPQYGMAESGAFLS